jgi:hypothetical protein
MKRDESTSIRPALRVLCAWCETTAPVDATVDEEGEVSHGICRACALRYFALDPLEPHVIRARAG